MSFKFILFYLFEYLDGEKSAIRTWKRCKPGVFYDIYFIGQLDIIKKHLLLVS